MANHTPTTALMRHVARTFSQFYREREPPVHVSQGLAVAQHEAYAAALRAAGLRVEFVAADDEFPDCVFIEDPAVVWPPGALITRVAPHRRGEPPPVEEALARWHEISRVPEGALLEGGDVLHVGDTTYVGRTGRTNAEGIGALRDFLRAYGRRVVEVPVDRSLHLKTAVTYLGDGAVVAAPDRVDTRAFEVGEVVLTDEGELGAANCLRLGGRLLVPRGYPETERRLRRFADRKGVEVVTLDISEFEKADGSLTCLSIVW